MRRRFDLDKEAAQYRDRDGRVLHLPPIAFLDGGGKVVGTAVAISVQIVGDKGGVVCSLDEQLTTTATTTTTEGQSLEEGRTTPPLPPVDPADAGVLVVYTHWLKVFGFEAEDRPLTPSRRRSIERVLKEATVAECCHAIDGLHAWRQKKPGDTNLSAVFGTRPQGRPLREQIEFFMGQVAGIGTATVTTDEMVKINRAKSLVLDAFDMPGSEKLKEDAARARTWLEGEGWTIEAGGPNGRPTFRAPQ